MGPLVLGGEKNKKQIKNGVVDDAYQTIFFQGWSQNQKVDDQRHLYKDDYKETKTKSNEEKKMCLLMFACLPVYLLICLFIIWKWLYKLSMNMLLQIQIILFYISWFLF